MFTYNMYELNHKQEILETYQQYTEQYFEQHGTIGTTETKITKFKKPPKVIVVEIENEEKQTYKISSIYLSLPNDMRTNVPKDTNIIVKLTRHYEKYGDYYLNGLVSGFAYRSYIKADIIDVQSNRIIKSDDFSGGLPPYRYETTKGGFQSRYGDSPDDLVLEWIKTSLAS